MQVTLGHSELCAWFCHKGNCSLQREQPQDKFPMHFLSTQEKYDEEMDLFWHNAGKTLSAFLWLVVVIYPGLWTQAFACRVFLRKKNTFCMRNKFVLCGPRMCPFVLEGWNTASWNLKVPQRSSRTQTTFRKRIHPVSTDGPRDIWWSILLSAPDLTYFYSVPVSLKIWPSSLLSLWFLSILHANIWRSIDKGKTSRKKENNRTSHSAGKTWVQKKP